MEYGAIDLHLRSSVIRIVGEEGSVKLDRRIMTTREGLQRVFADRPAMRVLLETGTESEWVAQTVESYGHEVIVADPNYTLMYGHRQRRVKTDRRDVAALAEACRLGIYRRAHRASATQRQVRRQLRVREQLVRIRTQTINLMRAQLRQEGYRLPAGTAETAGQRLGRLALPPPLQAALAPLGAVLETVTPAIRAAERDASAQAHADPVVSLLMTAPGIGPVTALAYRATLDDVRRFRDAGAATAFLGLVPSEDSSAERRQKGRITKAGPRALRALLVQAAWVVWRQRAKNGELQLWAHRLAARRGRRIAVVALARRLARILFAMWRDQRTYCPTVTSSAA